MYPMHPMRRHLLRTRVHGAAAVFLTINGFILIAGERFRRHASREADEETARQREYAELAAVGRHSASARADRQREHAAVTMSDGRLASLSYPQAILIGSAQILALIAGISRDFRKRVIDLIIEDHLIVSEVFHGDFAFLAKWHLPIGVKTTARIHADGH